MEKEGCSWIKPVFGWFRMPQTLQESDVEKNIKDGAFAFAVFNVDLLAADAVGQATADAVEAVLPIG